MSEEQNQDRPQFLPLMEEKTAPLLNTLFPGPIPERVRQNIYRWSLSPLRVALFDGDTNIEGLSDKEVEYVRKNHLTQKECSLVLRYNFLPQFKTLHEFRERAPEIERTRTEANAGLKGYEDMHHLENEADVAKALAGGTLVPIPNLNSIRVSTTFEELSIPELRSCIPSLKEVLEKLDERLQRGALKEGQSTEIISATRTIEMQQLLIKLGYYAALKSTHTFGGAVDITSRTLDSETAENIWKVLEEAHKNGEIIFVREKEESEQIPYKLAHLSIPAPKR